MSNKGLTEHRVYCYVCEHPGVSTYAISKRLGMTGGSVRYALCKLRERELIRFKFDKKNPRIKKLSYPVDSWSLLPSGIRGELKRICKKQL